jgi:hypothetical protein
MGGIKGPTNFPHGRLASFSIPPRHDPQHLRREPQEQESAANKKKDKLP